jgi:hypothetical protein
MIPSLVKCGQSLQKRQIDVWMPLEALEDESTTHEVYELVHSIDAGLLTPQSENPPEVVYVVEQKILSNARGLLLDDALIRALNNSPNIINAINDSIKTKVKSVENALVVTNIVFEPGMLFDKEESVNASNSLKIRLTVKNFASFAKAKAGSTLSYLLLPNQLNTNGEIDLILSVVIDWVNASDKRPAGLLINVASLEVSVGADAYGKTTKIATNLLWGLRKVGFLPFLVSIRTLAG